MFPALIIAEDQLPPPAAGERKINGALEKGTVVSKLMMGSEEDDTKPHFKAIDAKLPGLRAPVRHDHLAVLSTITPVGSVDVSSVGSVLSDVPETMHTNIDIPLVPLMMSPRTYAVSYTHLRAHET